VGWTLWFEWDDVLQAYQLQLGEPTTRLVSQDMPVENVIDETTQQIVERLNALHTFSTENTPHAIRLVNQVNCILKEHAFGNDPMQSVSTTTTLETTCKK
jgi:hypothetical protein